jgi:carboxylesterase
MIDYIIGLFVSLALYRQINLFLIRRRIKKNKHFKIMKGAEPFYLKSKEDKKCNKGILLIHGFTSSPWELKELGNYLHKNGLTVYAPLLSGHGTTPGHLLTTKLDSWISDVEKALKVLESSCNEIYVLGNSFGGNLAFIAAAKSKKVKGVISLAAPFVFVNEFLRKGFFYSLRQIKLFQKKIHPRRTKKIYEKTKRVAYNQVPLISLFQMTKCVTFSKKFMDKVKCRILLMQSDKDTIVSKESVDFTLNAIKSKDKKVVWVKDSVHVFLSDNRCKAKVFAEIYDFVKN